MTISCTVPPRDEMCAMSVLIKLKYTCKIFSMYQMGEVKTMEMFKNDKFIGRHSTYVGIFFWGQCQ